ncbi:MAG: hypothetical protein QXV84_06180, partial [Conexivisphaerales archaeon]
MKSQSFSVLSREILFQALVESFRKLNPFAIWRNFVIFLVEIVAIAITFDFFLKLSGVRKGVVWFTGWTTFWLWLTVFFSTFAESLSEIRGKARAESLKSYRTTITAKKVEKPDFQSSYQEVPSTDLRKGDLVLVQEGDLIPGDGEIIAGAALVNEAAVTGE